MIFPILQPTMHTASAASALPLARETAWNFEGNFPIFRAGQPLTVTGKDAVKVWIWKALQTWRFRHPIYTFKYGCEIYSLIGQAFTARLKEAEAARYIRECLLISPYITAVRDVAVDFDGDDLTIDCTVDTIYGEVKIHV